MELSTQPNRQHEATGLVLPPGGAMFRIDTTRQLARAAGTRPVYSLPFHINDDAASRRTRLKVWFSPTKELKASLLISSSEGNCCPLSNKAAQHNCCGALLTSGRLLNQAQNVFCELWSLKVIPSYNAQVKSALVSEYRVSEESFHLQINLKKFEIFGESKKSKLSDDLEEKQEPFPDSTITIEKLSALGFICDNTLVMNWNVEIMQRD